MSTVRHGHLFRAYAAAPLGVERDEAGRVWCQLFPLETWHRGDFPDGKLELTADLMGAFIANWRAAGAPALPVDYEHEEQGPASGWIEDLRLGPAGDLQGAIRWTDDAADDIKADRRRYLSPTWAMQHTNRRTGAKGGPWLYGAALTNSPFFDSMPRVAASAALAATSPTHNPPANGQEQRIMDKKRICAALGMPEETEDDKVIEALEAMAKGYAASLEEKKDEPAPEEKPADEKPTEEKVEASATVEKLHATVKSVTDENVKLRAALLARDVEALCVTAKLAGKPVEAMREFIAAAAARDGIEAAQKLVAALPVIISTVEKGVTTEPTLSASSSVTQFEALVEEKVKAGSTSTVAYRLVASERPDLAALVFPSPSTTR